MVYWPVHCSSILCPLLYFAAYSGIGQCLHSLMCNWSLLCFYVLLLCFTWARSMFPCTFGESAPVIAVIFPRDSGGHPLRFLPCQVFNFCRVFIDMLHILFDFKRQMWMSTIHKIEWAVLGGVWSVGVGCKESTVCAFVPILIVVSSIFLRALSISDNVRKQWFYVHHEVKSKRNMLKIG